MSGWSATGFRVVLGTDESDEFRDFFGFSGTGEDRVIVSVTHMKRPVTVQKAEWRGLTQDGAAMKTATSGWRITNRVRAGESDQWTVQEELKTEGDWEAA